jgi:cytochrome c biogenesis protein CcmG, thiol:disulfide interchange protein DsbE
VERIVRRIWVGLVLGTILVAGCDRGNHPNNIDKPAPQFILSDGTRTADLSKLRGRVVVLNLWASWCAPCIEELPSLLALQKQMPELAVVAVSMDQDPDVYRRFLAEHHVDVLTVRDEEQRVNALYGTVQIPETYIIDRQGVLRRKFIGAQNWTSPEITGYLSRL